MSNLLSENEIRRFLKLSNVNSDKSLVIDKRILEEAVKAALSSYGLPEKEPPIWAAGEAGSPFRKELAAGFPVDKDEDVWPGTDPQKDTWADLDPQKDTWADFDPSGVYYEPEPLIIPAPAANIPAPAANIPIPVQPAPIPVQPAPIPVQPAPIPVQPSKTIDDFVEPDDINQEMGTITPTEKKLIDAGLISYAGNANVDVRNVEKAYATQGAHDYLDSINSVDSLRDDIVYVGDISRKGGGKFHFLIEDCSLGILPLLIQINHL